MSEAVAIKPEYPFHDEPRGCIRSARWARPGRRERTFVQRGHLVLVTLFSMHVLACSASTVGYGRDDAATKADTRPRDGSSVATDTGAMDGSVPDTSLPSVDSGGEVTDTGTIDSAVSDSTIADADSGPSTTENATTGITCTSDVSCDRLSLGTSFCSSTGFTAGSLYPTPVCFGVDCDPGDGTKIVGCDADRGVCLKTTSSGICLPSCAFGDSTAAPTGCVGKNRCNVYGWDSSAGTTIGVGYCFGGCKADIDCPTGNVCQVEEGLCVKTRTTFTKTPGTACTSADSNSCNCLYATATGTGYCANACYVGETTCPSGFTCDAGLPKTKLRSTDTEFSVQAPGLAGYCLKNCATDADCAGLNAYCSEDAGTGQKTCHVGKRPCVTNDHCPSPQTCFGATATSVGYCG